jgi:hypothetical protein
MVYDFLPLNGMTASHLPKKGPRLQAKNKSQRVKSPSDRFNR